MLKFKSTKNELLPDVPEKITKEHNLKIIFCGMAVGKTSARVGGYYADKRNKFWDVLCDLEFTDKNKIRSCEYEEILEYKLGLTDLVKKKSGADKKIKATKDDIEKLEEKIKEWNPQILAFNGKKPAQKFLNKKKLPWGEQIEKYGETKIWVLPSTAGLNTRWVVNNHEMIWKNLYQNIKQI